MTGKRADNGNILLELTLEELQVLGNALTFYEDVWHFEDGGRQSKELEALGRDLSAIEDAIL